MLSQVLDRARKRWERSNALWRSTRRRLWFGTPPIIGLPDEIAKEIANPSVPELDAPPSPEDGNSTDMLSKFSPGNRDTAEEMLKPRKRSIGPSDDLAEESLGTKRAKVLETVEVEEDNVEKTTPLRVGTALPVVEDAEEVASCYKGGDGVEKAEDNTDEAHIRGDAADDGTEEEELSEGQSVDLNNAAMNPLLMLSAVDYDEVL